MATRARRLFASRRYRHPTYLREGARHARPAGRETGLVLNVANDRSIAWHIGNNAIKQGATVGFGYLPLEKMERRARKSLDEMGAQNAWLQPCDVGSDESIAAFFKAAQDQFDTIGVSRNFPTAR